MNQTKKIHWKKGLFDGFLFCFLQDANTSGEETTDGAVEEIEGDAHSHPRGKPSYVPRGRGRGGPRGFRGGRFIRRGGGGTRYPSKYLGKEGGDEQQVQTNLDLRKTLVTLEKFLKSRFFLIS